MIYILVTGHITIRAAPPTQVRFKNCAPFTKCITNIGWISWSFVSTFSCFISTTSNFFSSKKYKWRGVRRAGRGYMDKNF